MNLHHFRDIYFLQSFNIFIVFIAGSTTTTTGAIPTNIRRVTFFCAQFSTKLLNVQYFNHFEYKYFLAIFERINWFCCSVTIANSWVEFKWYANTKELNRLYRFENNHIIEKVSTYSLRLLQQVQQ